MCIYLKLTNAIHFHKISHTALTDTVIQLYCRQSRFMAYRQFINWVRRGQHLGKKIRVVIPSCVVTKIRGAFPSEDGNYEGFHEASDSDTDSE